MPPGDEPAASGRSLLLLAVGLTGATALAYEVAWSRGLVTVLGSTTTTTAVVLAAFVGALGLGARWGGTKADRHERPLELYGLLEIGAAVWAVLALELAQVLLGPYAAVARPLPEILRFVLRVVVAAIVVAPGAFLLGATLPALVRFWVRRGGETGRGTAWVYGANTLGAVAGALGTGFFAIEALGVRGALLAAAALASVVGVVAALVGRRSPVGPAVESPPVEADGTVLPLRPALAAAAICGGIGLGLEVAGFRILVFFVEGFTATFAAMLGVFILGLGLGSLLLGPRLTRSTRPDRVLGRLLLVTGLVLGVLIWLQLPNLEQLVGGVRAKVYQQVVDAEGIQAALHWTALAGSAALLLLPAILLGATFPLCVRWAELAGLTPGRAVGRVYLWNSVGTLLAPFVVGFGIVPLHGVRGAWDVLAALCLFGGLAISIHVDRMRERPARAWLAWGFAGSILAMLLVAPAVIGNRLWPPERLVEASHVMRGHPERRLLEVKTDAVTTASVVALPGEERILYTDDFAAAATGRHYRYMRMLGHLPVLLAKDPKQVMVIAFGTGTTAGAVAAHDEVERLEVVEVSRAVYDLAGYFEAANRGVLADGRTTKIRDDGRNALLLHAPDLDVITLEPLMPYSPAGLPFYTKEFYELARDRLRDGGVLCQWVPVHAMPAGLYAALVRTFFEVFPTGGSLWFFEQSSALIAVKGEGADRATFDRRAAAVQDDLAAAGFTTPDLVLSGFVASGANVIEGFVPPSQWKDRTVTDFDPFPEFHPSPRARLSTPYLQNTLTYLWQLTAPDDVPPYLEAGTPTALRVREGTVRALKARIAEAAAEQAQITRQSPDMVVKLLLAASQEYGLALQALPGEAVLRWRRARMLRQLASLEVRTLLARVFQAREEGRQSQAEEDLRRTLGVASQAARIDDGDAIASERWRSVLLEAAVLRQMGRCDSAAEVLVAGAAALPARSVERALLRRVHEADDLETLPPEVQVLFDGAPPCREEGLALIAPALERWREARAAAVPRMMTLAADNLYQAARRDALESAVAKALRDAGSPTETRAYAIWATLLRRLDRGAKELEAALTADGKVAAIALEEAGRTRTLGLFPEVAEELAKDADPTKRIALANAAGADGARTLLLVVVDLLLDEDREVRMSAAAALVRHHAVQMAQYDPDAPESDRQRVVEALRTHLR